MTGCNLYNGTNLNSTGGAFSNPYSIIQNGGKKRRTRQRKSSTRKRRKNTSKKTKSRSLGKKGSLIQLAYRYFNIY